MKDGRDFDLKTLGWLALLLLVITSPNILNFVWIPGPLQLARVVFGALLVLLPLVLLRMWPRLYLLLLLPVFFLVYADLVHMLNYGRHLSVGAVASFFYTDSEEAVQFLWHTSRTTIPIMSGLVIAAIVLYFSAPRRIPAATWHHRLGLIGVVSAIPLVFDMQWAFPVSAAGEIHSFYETNRNFKQQVTRRASLAFEGVRSTRAGGEEIFVLVLGESASRNHFALYGYDRPTTPRLSERKDLIVFDDVSAPANLTQYSLYIMLSPATAQRPELFHMHPSIIWLANAAGFETHWISNQSKMNRYNNEVSVIAEEAKQRVFRATGNVSSLDGALLPHLGEALVGAVGRKFVVLHTLGSHIEYEERYPREFAVFSGRPSLAKVDDPAVWKLINAYDNSILYTDQVLDQVIARVEGLGRPGCVVYTSDHGEHLSPVKPISGHGYPRALRSEAEIPLIVWCSSEFRRRNPATIDAMTRNRALPIAGEDLFHALADLFGVEYSGMDRRRSFFSADYVPPTSRWIRNSGGQPANVEQLKSEIQYE